MTQAGTPGEDDAPAAGTPVPVASGTNGPDTDGPTADAPAEAPADASADAVAPEAAPACQNCGAPLLGPHCYRCGQPVKGLVRHFTSIVGDFFDSVFDFDSRTLRTLWPLYAKPGYLSCEYFEGRRVRYVSPVRLFFFLTIVAFFVGSLTLHVDGPGVQIGSDDASDAAAAAPASDADADAEADAEAEADADTAEDAAAADDASGEHEPSISFGDGRWDAETNPLVLSFLPEFANDWLNVQIGRAEKNIERLQDEPDLYLKALLSAVPTTLFVLLPVFALMLKVAYLFKRRLYMEHLIVALHSHAFLSFSLLLLFLLEWLERALPSATTGLQVLGSAILIWIPIYLLLMQKRVYRQGWPMTLLKYCVLGICYLWLTSIGAVVVALGSLVWM